MTYPTPTPPAGVDADTWQATVDSIRSYCGWHIAPEVTETVTVDGPGGDMLFLPTLHLVSLGAVTSDGNAATDLEWSRSGMVKGHWSSRFRGVTVTMTHGYETWPAELQTLAGELIAASGREGVSSVTSGPHQVAYESPMSDRQRDVLDRYRLVTVP